jgi:ferric-dicitrate binding protein FerR (iron transport regulator)
MTLMAEEQFTELLAKRLSGEISADELLEFNRLIAGNTAFQKEYEAIKSYWAEDDEPYENVVSIFDDIKRRAGISDPGNVIEFKKAEKARIWPLRIAAAAAVLILVSVSFYFLKLKNAPATTPIAFNELKTGIGAIKHIRLADGTSVTLNAVSVLKYPTAFNGKTREVYLIGEGYFDVAKDHRHPFIVHTNRSDIRVLGTAFDIKCYDNDSLFEATLFRGSIQASINNVANDKVLLKPSDKLVVANTGYYLTKGTHLNTDTTNIETAWIHNKLIFKNQPFGLLANSLTRKYGMNFIFKNNALKTVKLDGEFDNENINQVLLSLKVVAKCNYSISDKDIYVFN